MRCSSDLCNQLLCVIAILLIVTATATAGPTDLPPNGVSTDTNPQTSPRDPLDCPLLPACPGESSVPLPPVLGPRQPSVKGGAPAANGGTVLEEQASIAAWRLFPRVRLTWEPDNGGRPDERPAQRILLKEFYIAKHQVTASEFSEFLNQQGRCPRTAPLG